MQDRDFLPKEQRAQMDLLNAYTDLCPAEQDKLDIRTMIAEMYKDGETTLAVCRAITSSIYVGLTYGNWPSAIREMQQRWA